MGQLVPVNNHWEILCIGTYQEEGQELGQEPRQDLVVGIAVLLFPLWLMENMGFSSYKIFPERH